MIRVSKMISRLIKSLNYKPASSTSTSQSGFTLIELLIYITIFSGASLLIVNLIFVFVDIQSQVTARSEVQHNLRFSLDSLARITHSAQNISSVSSSSIVFSVLDPVKNPTTISLSSSSLILTEGIASPEVLTSDSVNVDSLSFEIIDNLAPAKKTVRAGISISYKDLGRTQMQYSETATTTISLR